MSSEFRCCYCNYKTTAPTRDHVIALSLGGSNSPLNVLDCCFLCNQAKGGLALEEFYNIVKKAIDKIRSSDSLYIVKIRKKSFNIHQLKTMERNIGLIIDYKNDNVLKLMK